MQLDRDRTAEIENYTTINQNLTSSYRPLSKNWFPGVRTIDQKHFWSCICHVQTKERIISDKMHLNNIGPESIHFSQKTHKILIPNIKHQRINGKNWTNFIIVKFQNFHFLKVPYFCRIDSGPIWKFVHKFFWPNHFKKSCIHVRLWEITKSSFRRKGLKIFHFSTLWIWKFGTFDKNSKGLLQGPRLMSWTTKSPIGGNHWVSTNNLQCVCSEALKYTASSCTDLADARFWIGSKNNAAERIYVVKTLSSTIFWSFCLHPIK